MNQLTTLASEEFHNVRTLIIDGEHWFVAKDIAINLGFQNPLKAVTDYCHSVMNHAPVRNASGIEWLELVIPKRGVYILTERCDARTPHHRFRLVNWLTLLGFLKEDSINTNERLSEAKNEKKEKEMNELRVFDNAEFGQVRTMMIDGDVWFVAKDVAIALGYKNPQEAVRTQCDGCVKFSPILDSLGRQQDAAVIPEKGIYRLIMRSNLPNAIKFQDWVCDEVLPSIRKHGVYATDNFVEQALSDPQHMIDVLTKFKEERAKRIEAEKTVSILTHVNKTYTATEIAKECGLHSAQELNNLLKSLKIQYKTNGTWIPYTKYATLGYFDIKQEVSDSGYVIYHRRITQRGREFILGLFGNDNA